MIQFRKLIEIIGTCIIGFVGGIFVTRFTHSWYWLVVGLLFVLLLGIVLSVIVIEPEQGEDSFEAAMFLDPEAGKMLQVRDPFSEPKTVWSDNWYYYIAYDYDAFVEVAKKKTIEAGGPTKIYEFNNEAITYLAEIGVLGVMTGELLGGRFTVFKEIGRESSNKNKDYEVIPSPLDFDIYTVSGVQIEEFKSLDWTTVQLPKKQLEKNPFLKAIAKSDFSGKCMFGEFISVPLPRGCKYSYRHYWKELPENWFESSLLFDTRFLTMEIILFYRGQALLLDADKADLFGITDTGMFYRVPIQMTVKYRAKRWASLTSTKKAKATVLWADEVCNAIKTGTSFESHMRLWKEKSETEGQAEKTGGTG